MTQEFKELVEDFLLLLQDGSLAQDDAESSLSRLLDDLAVARRELPPALDDADYPDPPKWPYVERRVLVAARFPNYGHYNVALNVTTEVGKGEVGVGDAIDDIADIAGDLADTAWRLKNTSEVDAKWHFGHTFDFHWGQHLRSLQLYIYCLRNDW